MPIKINAIPARPPITPPAIAPALSVGEAVAAADVALAAVVVAATLVAAADVAAESDVVDEDAAEDDAEVDVAAAEVVIVNAEAAASSELREAAVKFFAGHPLEQGLLLQQPMKAGLVPVQVYQLLPVLHD